MLRLSSCRSTQRGLALQHTRVRPRPWPNTFDSVWPWHFAISSASTQAAWTSSSAQPRAQEDPALKHRTSQRRWSPGPSTQNVQKLNHLLSGEPILSRPGWRTTNGASPSTPQRQAVRQAPQARQSPQAQSNSQNHNHRPQHQNHRPQHQAWRSSAQHASSPRSAVGGYRHRQVPQPLAIMQPPEPHLHPARPLSAVEKLKGLGPTPEQQRQANAEKAAGGLRLIVDIRKALNLSSTTSSNSRMSAAQTAPAATPKSTLEEKQTTSQEKKRPGALEELVKKLREKKLKNQRNAEKQASRSAVLQRRPAFMGLMSQVPRIDVQRDVAIPEKQMFQAQLFEQRVLEEEKNPRSRNKSGDKTIKMPGYPVNVVEAADVLRISTRIIRTVLVLLNELPRRHRRIRDEDIKIEPDILELVAMELGVNFEAADKDADLSDHDQLLQRRAGTANETEGGSYESLPTRPPVVCIMGHVDHGKTTLMDTLRRRSKTDGEKASKKAKKKKKKKKAKTAGSDDNDGDVAGTEAGGITQAISAFQVPLHGREVDAVTFLDTPGHAAFSSMRQSGSDAADIIVLVVAADDGVSPQTVEIIEFYKTIVKESGANGIALVVALNKIDKPGVDVMEARTRVENQLLAHGIYTEGMGSSSMGSVGSPAQLFPISGLTGEGVDDLVEGLGLQSEVMDLRADDSVKAEGYIMDARIEKGLGVVANCVVRWGSLLKGDYILSGACYGKVRVLKDVDGQQIKQGSPSQPIQLTGFESVPKAGDPFLCVTEEEFDEEAKNRTTEAAIQALEDSNNDDSVSEPEVQISTKTTMMKKGWLEDLKVRYNMEGEETQGESTRIPIVIKADADGSLSAVLHSLMDLGHKSRHNVLIDPIIAGVGPLLESEVEHAKESNASIVCFNIRPSNTMQRMIEEDGVALLQNDVIYRLIESAREQFGTYLPLVPTDNVHGRAKVGAVFNINGMATEIAGLEVLDGSLYKDKTPTALGQHQCFYRVLRDDEVVSGDRGIRSTSLKHFKEDVNEIASGKECGLSLEGFNGYAKGDVIECFSIEMKSDKL